MVKANNEIREMAKTRNIPLWRIAQKLNISEVTLVRWLRVPLDENKEAEICKIIIEIGG